MFAADRCSGSARWPLVRMRGDSRTQIVLLSSRFFELTTHWVGHTVVCSGDDCALCETLPSRGLFYLACLCDSRVSIFELGGLSASNLEQHCKLLHGGIRPGLVIDVWRRGSKHPIRSEVVASRDGVDAVTVLDLAQHVLALYKFPPPNVADTIATYERRCQTMATVRNQQTAVRLRASSNGCVAGR